MRGPARLACGVLLLLGAPVHAETRRVEVPLVIRAPSGELLRVRSDAVYERDGDRLVLVCYAETLPYWLVHESPPGQDRSRDGGSEPEFERREAR